MVVVEEKLVEGGGFAERRWNLAGEGVGVEDERMEGREAEEGVGDLAGEGVGAEIDDNEATARR